MRGSLSRGKIQDLSLQHEVFVVNWILDRRQVSAARSGVCPARAASSSAHIPIQVG